MVNILIWETKITLLWLQEHEECKGENVGYENYLGDSIKNRFQLAGVLRSRSNAWCVQSQGCLIINPSPLVSELTGLVALQQEFYWLQINMSRIENHLD